MQQAGSVDSGFVGRGDVLAVVSRHVDMLRSGRPSTLLVEGEAGIGKSRVLGACRDRARAIGVPVVEVRAREHLRNRPFAPWAAALSLNDEAADARRSLLGAALAAGGRDSSSDQRFRIIDGIVALIAGDAPLVVCVDDLHWADPATLLVVDHLVALDLPLLVVGARRRHPSSPEVETTAAALSEAGLIIDMEPLDGDSVATLAEAVLGAPAGETLRRRLDAAGGNPLFAMELLGALDDAGALVRGRGEVEAEDVALPPTFQMAVLRRMRHLDEHTVAVVRMAAILGSAFAVEHLAAALAASVGDLAAPLEQARAAGILTDVGRTVTFRHDLVREAIAGDLGHSLRAALHREAGRRLAQTGAPATVVAPHLAFDAPPGDAEAVHWLRQAGVDAAPQDPGTGADLLNRALSLTRLDDPERDRLVVDLVQSLLWAGRFEEASRRARIVLARPHDTSVGAELRGYVARVLIYGGDISGSIAEVERALAADGLTEATGARLRADLALRHGAAGELVAMHDAATQALASGPAGEELASSTAHAALSWHAVMRGDSDSAIAYGRRALGDGATVVEAVQPVQARLYLGLALTAGDLFDEARDMLHEASTWARQLGAVWGTPLAAALLALTELHAGRWDEALGHADTTLREGTHGGVSIWDPVAHAVRATVHAHRGVSDDAAADAAAGLSIVAAGRGVRFTHPLLAAATVTAGGDRRAAQQRIDEVLSATAAAGVVCDCSHLAMAALLSGHDRERLGALAAVSHPTVAAAVDAVLSDDAHLAAETAAAAERIARPHLRAQVEEALVGALHDRDAAVAMADLAAAAYRSLGAQGDLLRLRTTRRRLGLPAGRRGRPPRAARGWSSLTPTERSVLDLVSRGLSNPQIADQLVVSRRTVESHVSNLLRKLGVATRVELAAAAVRRETENLP